MILLSHCWIEEVSKRYITLVNVFCFATVTQQTNHWYIFIFVFLKSFLDFHCSQHILIDYVLSRLNNSIMNSILNMRNVQISKMCQKAKKSRFVWSMINNKWWKNPQRILYCLNSLFLFLACFENLQKKIKTVHSSSFQFLTNYTSA